jgi:hypothetical protein
MSTQGLLKTFEHFLGSIHESRHLLLHQHELRPPSLLMALSRLPEDFSLEPCRHFCDQHFKLILEKSQTPIQFTGRFAFERLYLQIINIILLFQYLQIHMELLTHRLGLHILFLQLLQLILSDVYLPNLALTVLWHHILFCCLRFGQRCT